MTMTMNRFQDWLQQQSNSLEESGFALSSELRGYSLKALQTMDFPTRKDEEWRYTPVKHVLNHHPTVKTADPVEETVIKSLTKAVPDAHLIVFSDGKFQSELSDNFSKFEGTQLSVKRFSGLEASAYQRAAQIIEHSKLTDDNIFQHITRGLSQDGLFIEVENNAEIDTPLHMVFLSTGAESVTKPLNVVHLGPNSRLSVVQHFVSIGSGEAVTVPADYIQVDEGARLDLYKLGLESNGTSHISNTAVQIASSANITAHQYLLGSKLTRSNIEVIFSGEGASATLRGAYLGKKSQHLDVRTYLDHAQPHCESDQHFRGIMDDESRGVFNGMVLVRKHAQKTNAQQSNKNLLLSRDARVDTKPQLEIYADDVQCAHGATIGELDENALFYLQSRGISKHDAAQMLTQSFAAEITQSIPIDSLREYVQGKIDDKLTESKVSDA